MRGSSARIRFTWQFLETYKSHAKSPPPSGHLSHGMHPVWTGSRARFERHSCLSAHAGIIRASASGSIMLSAGRHSTLVIQFLGARAGCHLQRHQQDACSTPFQCATEHFLDRLYLAASVQQTSCNKNRNRAHPGACKPLVATNARLLPSPAFDPPSL